jgi:ABC-type nitrate/sulfonate/bicarbonate transport system ATPase subunit
VEPIRLDGVSWRPGGVDVIEGLSLSFAPGRITALLGRSGCGKSSLLRVVAGLRAIDAGRVSGRPARVGFVFQDPALLPWRTARENVALAVPRGEPADAAARVLDAVGLGGHLDALPATLSGGQRMRVNLARALVSRPQLLLLDEPFAALDPATRADMQRLVLEAVDELGCTVLLVSHDRPAAARVADRILLLEGPPVRVRLDLDAPAARPRAAADVAELVRQMEAAP